MKLLCCLVVVVIICLLVLIGVDLYAANELHQIKVMFDGIRGEIPMGH